MTEKNPALKKDSLAEITLFYEISRLLEQSLDLRDVVNPVSKRLPATWACAMRR